MQQEKLILSDLEKDQVVSVIAGEEPELWRHSFAVIEPGEKPLCSMGTVRPDGTEMPSLMAVVEGSGNWTTTQENPVQDQEKAFTIGHGVLAVGNLVTVIFHHADLRGRCILETPIAEISVQ